MIQPAKFRCSKPRQLYHLPGSPSAGAGEPWTDRNAEAKGSCLAHRAKQCRRHSGRPDVALACNTGQSAWDVTNNIRRELGPETDAPSAKRKGTVTQIKRCGPTDRLRFKPYKRQI